MEDFNLQLPPPPHSTPHFKPKLEFPYHYQILLKRHFPGRGYGNFVKKQQNSLPKEASSTGLYCRGGLKGTVLVSLVTEEQFVGFDKFSLANILSPQFVGGT